MKNITYSGLQDGVWVLVVFVLFSFSLINIIKKQLKRKYHYIQNSHLCWCWFYFSSCSSDTYFYSEHDSSLISENVEMTPYQIYSCAYSEYFRQQKTFCSFYICHSTKQILIKKKSFTLHVSHQQVGKLGSP